MGLYRDTKHKFNIYDAPKSGGTTLRSWILYQKYGRTMLNNTEYNAPTNEHYKRTRDVQCIWFKKTFNPSICIKRDPVDRFISCYKDKIIKEGNCNRVSIDELLDNFQHYMKTFDKPHPHGRRVKYVWYHFAPQVYQFGKDKSYYKHIFDLSEMNTSVREYLQDTWKIDLPQLHTRKAKSSDIVLTPTQIKKVESIYKLDYETGWF